MNAATSDFYRIRGKRTLDLVLASVALLLFFPVMLVVALAIKVDSKGSVFYRQTRCGLNETEFRIFKFRSMVTHQAAGTAELTVNRDPRITRVGHFIRKYKIDELPQLLNVFTGDMAVVGPRPEVPRYMNEYNAALRTAILSVRPGITDFAAILFRDENALLDGADNPDRVYIEQIMPVKADYYCRYIEQMSVRVDMWIIIETVFSIVTGQPTRWFTKSVALRVSPQQ